MKFNQEDLLVLNHMQNPQREIDDEILTGRLCVLSRVAPPRSAEQKGVVGYTYNKSGGTVAFTLAVQHFSSSPCKLDHVFLELLVVTDTLHRPGLDALQEALRRHRSC